MVYGGALFKIINSQINVKDSKYYTNYMFNKYGGFHLVNSELILKNNEFDGNKNPARSKNDTFLKNPY
jgi:hypothetical protein